MVGLGIYPYSYRVFTKEAVPSDMGPRPKVPSIPFLRPVSLVIEKNGKSVTQLYSLLLSRQIYSIAIIPLRTTLSSSYTNVLVSLLDWYVED